LLFDLLKSTRAVDAGSAPGGSLRRSGSTTRRGRGGPGRRAGEAARVPPGSSAELHEGPALEVAETTLAVNVLRSRPAGALAPGSLALSSGARSSAKSAAAAGSAPPHGSVAAAGSPPISPT
jgi:hypothetical protein